MLQQISARNMFAQNFNFPKIDFIIGQWTLSQRLIFWTQKFLGPKIFFDQIYFCPGIFWLWIFCWTQKNFDPKLFLTQEFFGPNFFLDQNIFLTKNFFWHKIVFGAKILWTQNVFEPKLVLDPNFFLAKKYWTQNFPPNSFGSIFPSSKIFTQSF